MGVGGCGARMGVFIIILQILAIRIQTVGDKKKK
jgi:hypothetical protein